MTEERGVSTGPLLGAFLAVVVLCAVFFSLGFVLGYRQARPVTALASERVSPPSDETNPEASDPSSSAEDPNARPPSTNAPALGSQAAESDIAQPSAAQSAPLARKQTSLSRATESARSLDSATGARVPSGLLVQVAAVTNQQDAENVVSVLKSRNYPALVLSPAQARAKDSFYRVVAGPYRSRTDAERVRRDLTAEGFKPFIR